MFKISQKPFKITKKHNGPQKPDRILMSTLRLITPQSTPRTRPDTPPQIFALCLYIIGIIRYDSF